MFLQYCGGGSDLDSDPFVPSAVIRKNTSSGEIFPSGRWTNENLWFGEFDAYADSGIARFEYSEGCTGNVSGVLNNSGVTYTTNQDVSRCIRAVDNNGNVSNWSSPYIFKIDKDPPVANVNRNGEKSGDCYVKENGSGKTYGDCFYTTVDVLSESTDNLSGISTEKLSCSAVTNDGKKWDLKTEKVSSGHLKVMANIPTSTLSIAKVTCKVTANDNAGNSSNNTVSFNLGNGWVGDNYANDRWNDWYYYGNGKMLTGWQNIYWYNDDYPNGQFNWYYFFDGTETASKNECYGPKNKMAWGWCKNIGGYTGRYFFNDYSMAYNESGNWFPDGSMFSGGTFYIDNQPYVFDASGRCVSGSGC